VSSRPSPTATRIYTGTARRVDPSSLPFSVFSAALAPMSFLAAALMVGPAGRGLELSLGFTQDGVQYRTLVFILLCRGGQIGTGPARARSGQCNQMHWERVSLPPGIRSSRPNKRGWPRSSSTWSSRGHGRDVNQVQTLTRRLRKMSACSGLTHQFLPLQMVIHGALCRRENLVKIRLEVLCHSSEIAK
jgi:hypothetical protein